MKNRKNINSIKAIISQKTPVKSLERKPALISTIKLSEFDATFKTCAIDSAKDISAMAIMMKPIKIEAAVRTFNNSVIIS